MVLSVTLKWLVGISKVYPIEWSAELLVSLQMLVAMMYWCGTAPYFNLIAFWRALVLTEPTVVILGSGLDHVLNLTPVKPEQQKGLGLTEAVQQLNSQQLPSSVSSAQMSTRFGRISVSRSTSRPLPRRSSMQAFRDANNFGSAAGDDQ
jgi:hypothetical protein